MNKLKKEIRLFVLLEKLKKRDLYNHLNNINLINEEVEKTDLLLAKINSIIQENSKKTDKNLLGATFKNKSKVVNIMSNKKQITENKKNFLLEQKNKTDLEIAKTFIQKENIKNKVNNKRLEYDEFKDLKLEDTKFSFFADKTVLGALFTIPEVVDEKKVHEFIVNPHIEKVLSSKKSSKNLGKLEIMYKDFFSKIPENDANQPIFKNDKVFDFNSRKVPNVLNIDLKLNKILKINNLKKNVVSKLTNNNLNKGLDIKISPINNNEISNEKGTSILKVQKK